MTSAATENEKLTSVSLTDPELALLDGQCSPKVQAAVDAAKHRLSFAGKYPVSDRLAQFIADVVAYSSSEGRVYRSRATIKRCDICGRSDGYYVYGRTTKMHRKGAENYDAPKTFDGYEFKDSFVTFKNRVSLGGCQACVETAMPYILQELNPEKVEIPKYITGEYPKRARVQHAHCTKCDWRGFEHQLGFLPAVIDGVYRGKCPSCGAENRAFGSQLVKVLETWEVIPVRWGTVGGRDKPFPADYVFPDERPKADTPLPGMPSSDLEGGAR